MRGLAGNPRKRQIFRGYLVRLALGMAISAFLVPASAMAQVAFNATLASNDVYRGRSQSADDPALTLAVAYESQSGFFAGGSIAVAAGDSDVRVSSSSQYLGYAIRAGRTSIEAGVVHRHSRDELDREYRKDYFEGFAGVARGATSLRLFASPDYTRGGKASFYASADTKVVAVDEWTLSAHGGLAYNPPEKIGGVQRGDYQATIDWRVSVSRPLGEFQVSVGLADSSDGDHEPFDGTLLFAKIARTF